MSNIDKAEKEIQKILKEHGLKTSYEIAFPRYNILPDEVQLALKILSKHGMKIVFILIPKQKQSK